MADPNPLQIKHPLAQVEGAALLASIVLAPDGQVGVTTYHPPQQLDVAMWGHLAALLVDAATAEVMKTKPVVQAPDQDPRPATAAEVRKVMADGFIAKLAEVARAEQASAE